MSAILILFGTLHSIGQGQPDSVQINWAEGHIKYLYVCCMEDTVRSLDGELQTVSVSEHRFWNPDGTEFKGEIEEFVKDYGDIVDLNTPGNGGEDEREYRELISVADSCFDKMDGSDGTVNRAIDAYVKAKEKLPDAKYPSAQLNKIREKLKKKTN